MNKGKHLNRMSKSKSLYGHRKNDHVIVDS